MKPLTLLTLFALGCSAPTEGEPYARQTEVLEGVPASMQESIDLAADRLLASTGLPWLPVPIVAGECATDRGIACYWRDLGEIHLTQKWFNMAERSRESVLLHEMGHAYGAGHVSPGVMASDINDSSKCLTAEDLTMICTFGECTRFEPEC